MQRLKFPACCDVPELEDITVLEYFELLAGMEMTENARLLALGRQISARLELSEPHELDRTA